MSWSTNTASRDRSVRIALRSLLVGVCLVGITFAQEISLREPSRAVAGEPFSIATTGSGSGTFYLVGPMSSLKRDIQFGQDVSLTGAQVQSSGRYVASLCAQTCSSISFFVAPAKPARLTLLVHPSRAPVGGNDVISAVAFPFDEFGNQNLSPATIRFQMSSAMKGSASDSRTVETRDGAAWFRTNSGKSAGALQLEASLNGAISRRVVQLVASDPCRLRIKGQRTAQGILVETEPVRDCSGNPVPDGTVVTFTAKMGNEISTVDAPVKQDVARARITAKGPVVISAASGVVMGNELSVGGQQ